MAAKPDVLGDYWRSRLAAPEKLDRLVVRLGSLAWLALLGAVSLIALALAWSVLAAIRVTVSGDGLLVPSGLRSIRAPLAGQSVSRHAEEDAVLAENARLLALPAGNRDLEAIVFVPVEEGKKVRPGMAVLLLPSVSTPETGGSVRGVVASVGPFASAEDDVSQLLAQRDLARRLLRNGPSLEVRVGLQRDSQTKNGYAWTSQRGGATELSAGTLLQASVTLRSEPPIALALPALRRWFTVP